MRDGGTLNPGNQHLTHLMLMSAIIINISHTHTHTQTYTETPCSPSHHLTYISTGGKFYPRAQCQHVCINKSTQNAHRVKELILSHYLFFSPLPQLYEFTLWLSVYLPIRLKPSQTHFISSSTGEPVSFHNGVSYHVELMPGLFLQLFHLPPSSHCASVLSFPLYTSGIFQLLR